jgi:hypothetical protein
MFTELEKEAKHVTFYFHAVQTKMLEKKMKLQKSLRKFKLLTVYSVMHRKESGTTIIEMLF